MGNLWFVRPIDSNVKHCIFQSINFLYTQHWNVQTHLISTVARGEIREEDLEQGYVAWFHLNDKS